MTSREGLHFWQITYDYGMGLGVGNSVEAVFECAYFFLYSADCGYI